MADRNEGNADRGGLKGDVPRSDHVAQPSERLTPEQEQVREALTSEQGRIPGGPPAAQGGTQGYPEERRSAPTTTGVGSDAAEWGSEAAGGSVIDTRRPERKQAAEREQSAERIGDRLREEK